MTDGKHNKIFLLVSMVCFGIILTLTSIPSWGMDEKRRSNVGAPTMEQTRKMAINQCYNDLWNRVTFTPGETTKENIRTAHEGIKDYCEEEADK